MIVLCQGRNPAKTDDLIPIVLLISCQGGNPVKADKFLVPYQIESKLTYIFIDFLTQLLALPLPSFSPLCHMIRHIRELTLMMASSPAVTKTASSGEAVMVVMGLVAAGRSASSEPSWRSQTSTDPSLPTVTISPLRRTLPPRNTTCAARV